MSHKQQQQMQEALDGTLSPDAYAQLQRDLNQDQDANQRYQKLQSVDTALQDARLEPQAVPNRLAMNIMAKIRQPEALPKSQVLSSGMSLALGLAAVMLVMLPLLLGLSLTILSTLGTASALSGLALGVLGAAVFAYGILTSWVSLASGWLAAYPWIFAALLLIPLAGFGLWRINRRGA